MCAIFERMCCAPVVRELNVCTEPLHTYDHPTGDLAVRQACFRVKGYLSFASATVSCMALSTEGIFLFFFSKVDGLL